MFVYHELDKKKFVRSSVEGATVEVIGVKNIHVLQIIGGVEFINLLRDLGYARKRRTNFVPLSKAQRAGAQVEFEAGTTKMRVSRNDHVPRTGDSLSKVITELSGMKPI